MRGLLAQLLLIVLLADPAGVEADPRWLLRALPGSYPDVTYFIPTDAQAIALTIDDGVDPRTTPAILDALQSYGVTATFFLLSDSIAGNEALVRRIIEEGHEIGHHMTGDEITVLLPDGELARKFAEAADKLEAYGTVNWFRPGTGFYDARMRALSVRHGYRIALASIAPIDTLLADATRMAAFIDWAIEPGSIVVLHDVGARGHRTEQTLHILLPRLLERGFQVMSLSRLAGLAAGQENRAIGSAESPALRQQ
jgi:peptidoglycan/xylan/chitin deacetylase (PgdA/CDA1 family)